MHNSCSTETGCCETETKAKECSTGSECPIEQATQMWKGAFCAALAEVKKEILKEKIRKAWGAKLDKSADAVLEAAEAEWTAKLSAGKAKMGLREKLASILSEKK
ncbi:MAG TPA: hypothetical protein VL404_05520 [Candidatus Eisenbacteria bacterium]|jgi:hypothetical protein|nr:hypothetical protein [Candidatus Eisenbacteria bacterium]